jgi:HAD superfamily hydrolase (TIGR01509 family)
VVTRAVIFDCDGVLVDSELIANKADVAALNSIGASFTLESYMARFVGMSHSGAVAVLADEFGLTPPPIFWTRLAAAELCQYARELRAFNGIEDLLGKLDKPYCVASSSSLTRLFYTLGLTDLLRFFPERVFSAEMVARGKPHPDLFLYAAQCLGIQPWQCVVVEDSPLGVQAAHAAGMRVIGFAGGSHMSDTALSRLMEAGPETIVHSVQQLAPLLC